MEIPVNSPKRKRLGREPTKNPIVEISIEAIVFQVKQENNLSYFLFEAVHPGLFLNLKPQTHEVMDRIHKVFHQ
jgi:hypothetical protein